MKKYFATLACSAVLAAGAAFAFTALPVEAGQCPHGQGVTYVSRDAEECASITFICPIGSTMFYSECGCGCIED